MNCCEKWREEEKIIDVITPGLSSENYLAAVVWKDLQVVYIWHYNLLVMFVKVPSRVYNCLYMHFNHTKTICGSLSEYSWRRHTQILCCHSGFYKCIHQSAIWAELIFLRWTMLSQLKGSTSTPWWCLTKSFCFTRVDRLERLIWIHILSLDKNSPLNFRGLHFSWVKWEPQAWSD